MLPKALFAAALASTATAILLPSSLDAPGLSASSSSSSLASSAHQHAADSIDVSLVSPLYHELATVNVPCPGCPLQLRTRGRRHRKSGAADAADAADAEAENDDGSKVFLVTNLANHLQLDLKIDHAPGHDRLLVNNMELYPDVDVHGGALTAVQVPEQLVRPHHQEHEEKEHKQEHEEEQEPSELKPKLRRHRKGGLANLERDTNDAVALPGVGSDVRFRREKQQQKQHHSNSKAAASAPLQAPLGYAMQVSTDGRDEASGMDIVALKLQIIEVNNAFVEDIPAVHVRLIRTAEGGLMIARIDVGDQDKGSAKETTQPAAANIKDRLAALRAEIGKCASPLCTVKAIMVNWDVVSASMRAHRSGCASKAMALAMGKAGKTSKTGSKLSDAARPHHGHHNSHPHQHKQHTGTRYAKQFVTLVVAPFVIGFVVTLAVALVGFVAGTAVVGLWRMLFRRGQAGACRRGDAVQRNLHNDEAAADDEKTGLMADMDADETTVTPPQAELPPYEDHADKTDSA